LFSSKVARCPDAFHYFPPPFVGYSDPPFGISPRSLQTPKTDVSPYPSGAPFSTFPGCTSCSFLPSGNIYFHSSILLFFFLSHFSDLRGTALYPGRRPGVSKERRIDFSSMLPPWSRNYPEIRPPPLPPQVSDLSYAEERDSCATSPKENSSMIISALQCPLPPPSRRFFSIH